MTREKSEATQTVSLRLDPELLRQLDELVERHHGIFFRPGGSMGEPKLISRADMVRWVLKEGIDAVSQKLKEAGKRGRS